jgi:hypothetical protein
MRLNEAGRIPSGISFLFTARVLSITDFFLPDGLARRWLAYVLRL